MRENIQIFPFYLSLDEQYHRRFRAFGESAFILAPGGYLPPFQLMLPVGSLQYTVTLVNLTTGQESNIKADMVARGLEVRTYLGLNFEILYYPSNSVLSIPNGAYYLRVGFTGGATYFSEVFSVGSWNNIIELRWWDDENIEINNQYFDFSTGFKFVAFLQTEFGKPLYLYEDTVKRRDGIDFPEKILSWKTYRCEIFCGEHFMDGLRVSRLHSFMELVTEGKTRKVFDLSFAITWDEPGFFAVVTLDFQMETIAKMLGKGKDIVEVTPQLAVPTGLILEQMDQGRISAIWMPVSGATSYVIQWKDGLAADGVIDVPGTTWISNTIWLWGREFADVVVCVAAKNALGTGNFTDWVRIRIIHTLG